MNNGSHETEDLIQTRRGEDGKPDTCTYHHARINLQQGSLPRYEIFRCSFDLYRRSIPRRKIAASLTSMLGTSSLTSAAQVEVKYDGGGAGVVVSRSRSRQKIVKKSKNRRKAQKHQRSEKFAKAIGSEERLPNYRSSVGS